MCMNDCVYVSVYVCVCVPYCAGTDLRVGEEGAVRPRHNLQAGWSVCPSDASRLELAAVSLRDRHWRRH
jgi:hypothetical protein